MRPSTHVYLFLQPFLLLSEGGDGSLVAGNGGQGVLPLLLVAAQLSLQNLHCTTTLLQLGGGGEVNLNASLQGERESRC